MRWVRPFLVLASVLFIAAVAKGESPTFNRDIAPIVFNHCASCHRAGEVAPFPLVSYADVKKRAEQIVQVTADRYMPPWKSVEGHGRFVGERRLTKDQINVIAAWVRAGSPEGDPSAVIPMLEFEDGWQLGEPDIVITMDEPYAIPADGPDIYRNFVLKLDIPEGKYIKAAEYRPGNRRIVHHAALAMDVTPNSRNQDATDPAPGFRGSLNIPGKLFPGSLAAWAPGRAPMPLPDGLSMPWKPGADLLLQLHLHPSGKPEAEQSSIGFYLTDEPPRQSMVDLFLLDQKIDIPPGEKAYRTKDEVTLPIAVEAFGVFPHMHMIGGEMKITAYPPEGEPISLLWINDWDFNWQNFYQYETPVKLPAGTRVTLEAVHDNSADNIRNPNHPPKRVRWGEQTTDEMSAAILQLVPMSEADLPKLFERHRKRILGGITAGPQDRAKEKQDAADQAARVEKFIIRFDTSGDKKLDIDELAQATGAPAATIRPLARGFDKDGDGALNAEELSAAIGFLGKQDK